MNNNNNNINIIKTSRPTSFPTYLDEDDDAYTGFYDKFDVRFTTYRDGYDVLSYFLPNASDLYSYKFLKPYTGLVEPYATMWISITDTGDDVEDRKYNHKYTICDTNNDGFIDREEINQLAISAMVTLDRCTANDSITLEQHKQLLKKYSKFL
jgi:hypothetical protein